MVRAATGTGDAAESVPARSQPATPTLHERAYAHRQSLFLLAAQLLDDVAAAQQVVAETLRTALVAGLSEPQLEQQLDRRLINLVLVRLKALPTATPASAGATRSDSAWPMAMPSLREAESSNKALEPDALYGGQAERTALVLAALPVEARVTVMLVLMQGRSLAEAAELLGTSEEACRFFLNQGRKLLRRALQRDLISGDGDGQGHTAGMTGQPGGGTTTLHDLRRNKKAIARA